MQKLFSQQGTDQQVSTYYHSFITIIQSHCSQMNLMLVQWIAEQFSYIPFGAVQDILLQFSVVQLSSVQFLSVLFNEFLYILIKFTPVSTTLWSLQIFGRCLTKKILGTLKGLKIEPQEKRFYSQFLQN